MDIHKRVPIKNKKPISAFLQWLFIYFWFGSLFGHYMEIILTNIEHFAYGTAVWTPIVKTVVPLAIPYGLGIVAMILFTMPLIKKYKLNPPSVFMINIFITGTVEYLCAVTIVLFAGYNRFWNYLKEPFNINGYVCLKSALFFSIAATLFIYLIYPVTERLIRKLKTWQFNLTFWVLFTSYLAEMVNLYIKGNMFG